MEGKEDKIKRWWSSAGARSPRGAQGGGRGGGGGGRGGGGGGAKKNKPEVRISAGMQPSNRLMRREGS